jgi:hypothetical protein
MFVTRNTEYHFRDGVCVAVRDRRSGRWQIRHEALSQRLTGGVRFYANGTAVPLLEEPVVGEALYFADHGRELITSLVCGVDRPQRDIVAQYPCD